MSATSQAFYGHKRDVHSGNYKPDCSECQQKWAAMVAESKAKAGVS